MLVISVLAYIAVPIVEVARFRMDGAARGSMAALVAAQRLAVSRQHDVVITFDTVHVRLRIHQDRNNDGLVNEGEPIRTVNLDEGVAFGRGQAPAMGTDAGAVTFTERQDQLPALRFIRNGSASEEGTFYLTSTRTGQGAKYERDARAVRVERSTGRVMWYSYNPPAWREGL
jgi:hypothetical protein